jgi:hypothetical protein
MTGGTLILDTTSITKGSGSSNIDIFGVNLDGVANPISSGSFTIPSSELMTIPSSSIFKIDSGGSITNNGTIGIYGTLDNSNPAVNNNVIYVFQDGNIVGIITNNGKLLDFNETGQIEAVENDTLIIPPGMEFNISEDNSFLINGRLLNQSGSTINIYGNIYTYSLLQNGDESNPGTINVNHSGSLYLLNGALENKHADSVVNVNSGGSLYNYNGTVDIGTGGSDSLDIKAGGKYHNVRGNYPGTFTLNNGCKFLDSNEISLDKDLDLDSTWTITEKVVINGFGNKITFGTDGAIIIDKDASLLLNDIIVENVSGNKIDCVDNNSTLSIDNVAWIQDANFSYTFGRIYVAGDWTILGTDTIFSYETTQTSTIASNAKIILESTTFKYNSSTSELLEMTDQTSQINLNLGTLLASKDCSLSNGTLVTKHNSILNGSAILDLQSLNSILMHGSPTLIGTILT